MMDDHIYFVKKRP